MLDLDNDDSIYFLEKREMWAFVNPAIIATVEIANKKHLIRGVR